MADSYLQTGFNNGPTPSNPWADYLANRNNRKHEQLMENKRHTNNVELASMQHQHAQERDKKNYKRGKKEAGRDREWQTGERIGGQQWQTSEREGNQTFQSAESKKSYRRGKKENARGRDHEINMAQMQMQQAQAIQQGVDPKTAVLNAEVQSKIARQNAETMANIQRQNTKAMADLSRRNAKTTADIQRANATAESNLVRQG